jgi:hypothetical protein
LLFLKVEDWVAFLPVATSKPDVAYAWSSNIWIGLPEVDSRRIECTLEGEQASPDATTTSARLWACLMLLGLAKLKLVLIDPDIFELHSWLQVPEHDEESESRHMSSQSSVQKPPCRKLGSDCFFAVTSRRRPWC